MSRFTTITLAAIATFVSASAADESATVVALAENVSELSTLVTLVKAAGLVETLNKPTPKLTVLAPTNTAFSQVPKDILDYLEKNLTALKEVLEYHVLGEEVLAKDLPKTPTPERTLETQNVVVVANDTAAFVNDAKVVTADNKAENGVAHIIDAVLVPPGFSIPAPVAATLAQQVLCQISPWNDDDNLANTWYPSPHGLCPPADIDCTIEARSDEGMSGGYKQVGCYNPVNGPIAKDTSLQIVDNAVTILFEDKSSNDRFNATIVCDRRAKELRPSDDLDGTALAFVTDSGAFVISTWQVCTDRAWVTPCVYKTENESMTHFLPNQFAEDSDCIYPTNNGKAMKIGWNPPQTKAENSCITIVEWPTGGKCEWTNGTFQTMHLPCGECYEVKAGEKYVRPKCGAGRANPFTVDFEECTSACTDCKPMTVSGNTFVTPGGTAATESEQGNCVSFPDEEGLAWWIGGIHECTEITMNVWSGNCENITGTGDNITYRGAAGQCDPRTGFIIEPMVSAKLPHYTPSADDEVIVRRSSDRWCSDGVYQAVKQGNCVNFDMTRSEKITCDSPDRQISSMCASMRFSNKPQCVAPQNALNDSLSHRYFDDLVVCDKCHRNPRDNTWFRIACGLSTQAVGLSFNCSDNTCSDCRDRGRVPRNWIVNNDTECSEWDGLFDGGETKAFALLKEFQVCSSVTVTDYMGIGCNAEKVIGTRQVVQGHCNHDVSYACAPASSPPLLSYRSHPDNCRKDHTQGPDVCDDHVTTSGACVVLHSANATNADEIVNFTERVTCPDTPARSTCASYIQYDKQDTTCSGHVDQRFSVPCGMCQDYTQQGDTPTNKMSYKLECDHSLQTVNFSTYHDFSCRDDKLIATEPRNLFNGTCLGGSVGPHRFDGLTTCQTATLEVWYESFCEGDPVFSGAVAQGAAGQNQGNTITCANLFDNAAKLVKEGKVVTTLSFADEACTELDEDNESSVAEHDANACIMLPDAQKLQSVTYKSSSRSCQFGGGDYCFTRNQYLTQDDCENEVPPNTSVTRVCNTCMLTHHGYIKYVCDVFAQTVVRHSGCDDNTCGTCTQKDPIGYFGCSTMPADHDTPESRWSLRGFHPCEVVQETLYSDNNCSTSVGQGIAHEAGTCHDKVRLLCKEMETKANNSNPSDGNPKKYDQQDIGAIVGGAVGGALLMALLGGLLLFCVLRRRRNQSAGEETATQQIEESAYEMMPVNQ